jgi:hypothetical protein
LDDLPSEGPDSRTRAERVRVLWPFGMLLIGFVLTLSWIGLLIWTADSFLFG